MTKRSETDTAREQNGNIASGTETWRCPQEAYARLARIRALNDRLRTAGRGGIVLMTEGIAGLGVSTAKYRVLTAPLVAIGRAHAAQPGR